MITRTGGACILPGFVVLFVLATWTTPALRALAEENTEFVRLMNLGKAYLENRESKKAIEVLGEAVALQPKSAPALRNLGRAYRLARQREPAIAALTKAHNLEPASAATSYLLGLTLAGMSRFEEAVPHLEQAVSLDPYLPTLRFQLAGTYQVIGRHDKAAQQFHETLRLDPLHASAHFKLAAYARKAGDRDEFQRRIREFQRLRKLLNNQPRSADALERCIYTSAEALPMDTERAGIDRPAGIDVRFVDVTDKAFSAAGDRAIASSEVATAAVLSVDKAGRCTLFVAGSQGDLSLMKMSSDGVFQRSNIELKLRRPLAGGFCLSGNFHDDVPAGAKYDPAVHALTDVLLISPDGVYLLKQTAPGEFVDVTGHAGLAGLSGARARWMDYEHDGDLDLLVARDTGLELWQNNGDGRFENVTAQVGVSVGGPVSDVAAVDLDADVAIDIIAARATSPTLVFKNQRAGRFAPYPEPPGPWPPAKLLLSADFNNDGHMDTMLVGSEQAIVLFGGMARRQRFDLSAINVTAGAIIDYDNDGWLDVCLVGETRGGKQGAIRLFRNPGTGDWSDVAKSTGLAGMKMPVLAGLVAADLDADADTDLLLLTTDGRMRFLRNDGGHLNGQLKLRLVTLKTNPSAFGTHVELRRGRYWVTRTVEQIPIEIGLAGHHRLDTIQTVWTNGVVDNMIDVTPTATPLTIVEKNVAAGSCPFLYAWDGEGYRFVTDVLGNAPIGLPLRRDVLLEPDPEEIVLLGDAKTFPPHEGAYMVQVTSEFREVLYLDHARLLAVDHPLNVEVHPTDKLMPPPFPVSELWSLGSRRTLRRATGSDGLDRTMALQEIDGVFAPPGARLPPPFRGMCHPMSLTLDFGPIDPTRPLVLALTGWLQYGQASTNIALSQSRAHSIIPPKLEGAPAVSEAPAVGSTPAVGGAPAPGSTPAAGSASGDGAKHGHEDVTMPPTGWQPLDVVVGMPAGKTKTIICDLTGKLPPGTRRLRLTTTFEISWDRIALFERKGPPPQVHELLPVSADLQWRGFSEIKMRTPGAATTPDHDVVFDRPPWRTTMQGWCTRYGNVLELVAARDDRLVLVNAGDALTLRFDAGALPPIPDGHTRTFFFYSFGWEKDGDYNVTSGTTVEPMPVTDTSANLSEIMEGSDWRLRYNTRWVPFDQFAPRR